MKKNKYKIGDVVMLKSGGPKMTVSSVPRDPDPNVLSDRGSSWYSCSWFKGGSLEHGTFSEDLLIEPEPGKQTKEK